MSNEKELSNFTYFSYFFILTESIVIYAIKRNRRYQKDCWHCEKNSKELKRSQQTSFRKPRKKCSRVFFMKIRTNSHVSQGDKAYFTESFRNRKNCSPSLLSDQIHNNFLFQEVSYQNNLKTFIGKNKRWKGRLLKCKKNSSRCNSTFTEKITQSMTFLLCFSWKNLKRKFQELLLNLCYQLLSKTTTMVITANINKSFEPCRKITPIEF